MRKAAERAAARAPAYRAAGHWRADPVDLVRGAAVSSPHRTAVVDRGRSLTYADLDAAVDGAAASLRAAGVAPGDALLVLAANDVSSVVAIHGALRAGLLTMVAPASAGRAQVDDIVAMASPVLGLAPAAMLPELDGGRWQSTAAIGDATPVAVGTGQSCDPDEPSMVIFTSGTTSRPKGVVHSLNTMLSATRNYNDTADLTSGDNLFVISPLASVTGMMQAITVAPALGAQLTIETRFDDAATFDFLMDTGATFFGGPDLLLDRVLDEAARRGVTHVPLHRVPRRVHARPAHPGPRRARVRHRRHARRTGRRRHRSAPPGARRARRRRLADDGRPLGGVEVRIGSRADPAECCIRGAHLFLGYVDPDDDAVAFDDGWFRTGDLAELRDGRLRIVGRIKDIVIRNGLKIPISEVDGMVAALPGVEQCAGYGVADDGTGERLVMAVRLRPGADLAFETMLDALVAAGAAKWKIPEELVLWTDPFPETASGKVQRNLLDEQGVGRPRAVAPRLRD